MSPRAAPVALLLLLAGCSTPPQERVDGLEQELGALGLEATQTTGLIRGVVVDEAIRPLLGATVTLLVGEVQRNATTTEDGLFGFDALEPGTYFLTVGKLGFFDAQASTDVVAGEDEPPIVKVSLVRDVASLPYASLSKFEGFLECALSVIALCSAANSASGTTGNVTNDRFAGTVTVDKPPQLVQSEVVWQTTTAASDQLWLWHSKADRESGGYNGSCNCWAQGPSPLLMVTNETEAADEGHEYGTFNHVYLRVFTGSIDGTRNPLSPSQCYPGPPVGDVYCGGLGYSINQEFTVYTAIFYGYLPPGGWTFGATSTLPQPPA